MTLDAHQLDALARVPLNLQFGLKVYIEKGVEPGSFLVACIENDLVAAVSIASDQTLGELRAAVQWLYNHAPSEAWGSKEKRIAWQEAHADHIG